MNEKKCKVLAAEIRLETLKVIHSRGFGHVGGSMDLADLMAVLYGEVMKFDPKNPRWEDRDWLVLSKGHAGPVAYATFGLMGYYPMEEAYTLNHPHTKFPSHTDRKLTPGVDLTTGSLGQGVSAAVGMALAGKMDGKNYRVYTILGDGEIEEGQTWEAAMSAAKYKLDNLCAIVDVNGLQIDGKTADVMPSEPLDKKYEAFGWHVIKIDGHDFDQIESAVQAFHAETEKPTCIILDTVKGTGVSYMTNSVAWHGKGPNDEEYQVAMNELNAAYAALEQEEN
mgnify:CR=1 FL=1